MQKSKLLHDAFDITSFLFSKNNIEKGIGDEQNHKSMSLLEHRYNSENIKNTISFTEEDSGNDPESNHHKIETVKSFLHTNKIRCIKSRPKIESMACCSSHILLKTFESESSKKVKARSSLEIDKSRAVSEQNPRKKNRQSVYCNTLLVEPARNICKNNELYKNEDNNNQDYSTDDTVTSTREEHIYKIMQRKKKLNSLLQTLLEIRKKEKQEWNYFITQLKNKHGIKNDEMEPQVCSTETQTKKRRSWKPSENCKKVINDLYTASAPRSLNSLAQSSSQSNESCKKVETYSSIFENNHFCYPTASSGRLTILKRQNEAMLKKKNRKSLYKGMPIFSDINDQRESKYQSNYPNYLGQKSAVIKSNPVQDDLRTSPVSLKEEDDSTGVIQKNRDNTKNNSLKSFYDTITNRAKKCKTNVHANKEHPEAVSLTGIEHKLEDLIESINSLVLELQVKKSVHRLKNTKSISFQKEDSESRSNKKVNFNIEDQLKLGKVENYVCGMALDSGGGLDRVGSTLGTTELENSGNIRERLRPAKAFSSHEIISRRVYKKMHTYLNDVPTKDIGTEVTKSLSQTKIEEVEAVNSLPRANLASNPQPFGILGLMKISAEAVKGFLSYLPLVNGPEFSVPGMEVSRYVCNICGLAYDRASSLSEHIERRHCNGSARDCCVCRHLMDMERGPPGMFSCQFCGMRFTRAYCCELHQANCSKALGLKNDVESRLVILR